MTALLELQKGKIRVFHFRITAHFLRQGYGKKCPTDPKSDFCKREVSIKHP